jgi:hypothetical protein
VTRKREPRQPKTERPKKDDRSAALAVLASVGVTPDDDGVFPPWSQIHVLADAYLETPQFMARLRAAEVAELRAARAAIRELEGVGVSSAEPSSKRKLLPGTSAGHALFVAAERVIAAAKDHPKPGRPVEQQIDTVLQYGRSLGWDWKVCAAALFVSGAWTLGYAFAKKSFRDWNRRNTLPALTTDLWADEFLRKSRDWILANKPRA